MKISVRKLAKFDKNAYLYGVNRTHAPCVLTTMRIKILQNKYENPVLQQVATRTGLCAQHRSTCRPQSFGFVDPNEPQTLRSTRRDRLCLYTAYLHFPTDGAHISLFGGTIGGAKFAEFHLFVRIRVGTYGPCVRYGMQTRIFFVLLS